MVVAVAVVVVVTSVIDDALDLVLAGFFAVNHALTHGNVVAVADVVAAVVVVALAMLFYIVFVALLPFFPSLVRHTCTEGLQNRRTHHICTVGIS
jgi:hypothetical protein